MAMIPENPVVGGTVLRRAAIQSPNFVTGSAGWTINQDGSAEFNNLVIRNGQIVSGTALYYSGTPAAGNLIASIAAAAGTDSFGNHYLQDFGAYNTLLGIATMVNGGGITFFSGNLAAGWSSVCTINFDTGTQAAKIGSTGLEVIGGLTADSAIVNGLATFNAQAGNTSVVTVNQGPTSTNSAAQILIALTAGFTAQQIWLAGRVAGDTNNRLSLDVDSTGSPRIRFGPGGSAPDCTIQRDGTVTHRLDVNGADWDINTVGRGLMIAEGANARMGTGVLSAGAAIVSNTTVTANTRIFLTTQVASGTPGALRVGTVTPGSGFGVNSTNGADNSTFAYLLVEPG